MQMRELQIGIASPRPSEGFGKVSFFCEEILCAVSHTARLNEHNFCAIIGEIGKEQIVVGEPGQPRFHSIKMGALSETLPVLSTP